MTTTKAALSLLLATAATLTFTATSRAAVIFSTYNGNDAGTSSPLNNNSGKAIGFTLPNPLQPADTGSYQFDGVSLRLSGTAASTSLVVKLFSNDGSNTPGTELGALTSTTFTLTSTAATYTFTPSAALTLTAGTTYWIAVQSTEPENTGASLNWHTSNPQPSSYSSVGVATAGQIFGSGSNPSTWTQTSGVRNSLTIDATPLPIPEPAAPILTGAGLVSMAMLRRRSR